MGAPLTRVTAFIRHEKKWREEFTRLRAIMLATALTEDFKWEKPCYTLDGKNVVLMHGFKDYCALLFHKGALLKDPNGILIQQTENVQSARQIRFTNVGEISQLEPVIRAYVAEAIAVEKAGVEVDFKAKHELVFPDEFQTVLDSDPALAKAFFALTPGRQREYNLHFTGAKQSATRTARVEKALPRILAGLGLTDR